MKNTALMLLSALLLTLSGCGGTLDHIKTTDGKCLTCWNNPITGEPINHDGTSNTDQKPKGTSDDSTSSQVKRVQYTERKMEFSVPVNVDLAFVKVKKEFEYQTEQEIRQEWGSLASTKLQTNSFAYDAVPSAYYHMKARRQHDNQHLNIDSVIEKETESTSKLIVTYWLKNPVRIDAKAFERSLKKRYLKALNL